MPDDRRPVIGRQPATPAAPADPTTPVGDHPAAGQRERALALLFAFADRVLPAIVRRIARWKQLPRAEHPELLADVVQELCIDCLEAPERVLGREPIDRHQHWIRLAERWIYRQRVRGVQCDRSVEPDDLAAEPPAATTAQKHRAARVAELDVATEFVWLKNGRCNLRATADRAGSTIAAVQRRLDAIARRLGNDEQNRIFWQRRLAEALVGLGADLLRCRHELVLLPPNAGTRGRPDPSARLGRVRRLCARYPRHRMPAAVRHVRATWNRTSPPPAEPAATALEQATTLWPDHAPAWLWLFEARLCRFDRGGALLALRHAQRLPNAPRDRIALARARLLEANGRTDAALFLLQRAQARRPSAGRLHRALQRARKGAFHGARATIRRSASSRSAAWSPRTLLQ